LFPPTKRKGQKKNPLLYAQVNLVVKKYLLHFALGS
jgi:hypothetical protein